MTFYDFMQTFFIENVIAIRFLMKIDFFSTFTLLSPTILKCMYLRNFIIVDRAQNIQIMLPVIMILSASIGTLLASIYNFQCGPAEPIHPGQRVVRIVFRLDCVDHLLKINHRKT